MILGALLLAATTAAPAHGPDVIVEAGLDPAAAVEQVARQAWTDLEEKVHGSAWDEARPPGNIVLRRDRDWASPKHGGRSTLGVVGIRQNHDGVLDDLETTSIRHEMAHQYLFATCPASAEDHLFHEAFAIATSGEMAAWTSGKYVTIAQASSLLASAKSFDDPAARKAIARLLSETLRGNSLPEALEPALWRCATGAGWDPLTVAQLTAGIRPLADAFVVVSRHTGEVLLSEGAVQDPMPFGSTLKPFLLGGARAAHISEPLLEPQPEDAEWACGVKVPKMDAPAALLRSCNGYFREWARETPAVARFGVWGPVLTRLGLERIPTDVSEAIGTRSTLSLAPVAMARAYVLLAESNPDVLEIMRNNAVRGTLSAVKSAGTLAGYATKTGTVRDAHSDASVGWIVAISDDFIAVMARVGRPPVKFANALAARLERFDAAGWTRAEVQVFGLLGPDDVKVSCPKQGFVVGPHGPEPLDTGFVSVGALARRGHALCLGSPWVARVPGTPYERPYAGVFRWDPAPASPGAKTPRARRGSDIVFRTTLARYATGVVLAEDATIKGPAREALLRVVAHNAHVLHHGGRPVCDTTHCQAFLGTGSPTAADERVIAADVPSPGWLPFSQGGDEPWTERVPAARVESLLGRGLTGLRFTDGHATFARQSEDGAEFDESVRLPCEKVRGPLKLPSCPTEARREEGAYVFSGRGRGHGEGLDVEAAKRSRATADAILGAAYPQN